MFGIGMPELILILVVGLIVIGPKKIPDLAKSLGKAVREFKTATSEFKKSLDIDEDVVNEFKDVKKGLENFKNPDAIKSNIKEAVKSELTSPLPKKENEAEKSGEKEPEDKKRSEKNE